jgi:hypothetical protein
LSWCRPSVPSFMSWRHQGSPWGCPRAAGGYCGEHQPGEYDQAIRPVYREVRQHPRSSSAHWVTTRHPVHFLDGDRQIPEGRMLAHRHDRTRDQRHCGCSVRTLVCQRATSCEELLRCCAPLSDEYHAEPNQDGTCQNTQYSPGRGDVSRRRRNCNHHGQNKLDGCGDVILPPTGWRFGIPTVHCRRVGHPFLHATTAMLPGIDMIERSTSGMCGRVLSTVRRPDCGTGYRHAGGRSESAQT